MAKSKILLVDDDPSLLRLLALRLSAAGYEVDAVDGARKALGRIAGFQPQLVITDLRMEGMDGLALFDNLRDQHPNLPVILLTAHGTIPEAVEAIQRGLFAYLTKPFDHNILLDRVSQALRLSGGVEAREEESLQGEWRRDIISRSAAMEDLLKQAQRVADSEVSILIQSQSGTGKELLAKAIHQASPRAAKPFLAINCAAMPESLLESELFGHGKGSFTGAVQSHKGLFQAADGGTLFLDEIGDMPISFQAKLLRVLQEGEVRPVGSTQSVPVNVRIICATHRDLEAAIKAGTFREDLFYRLNVVMLELPPLAARREDIPLLANHFLAIARQRHNSSVRGFSPEALELLVGAPWPGNARQLLNVVEQVAVLSTTPIVSATAVQKALRDKPTEILSLGDARDRFERDYLVQVLQITEGNVSKAARLAQRNRTEFYKILKRHQLDPELFRRENAES